MPLQYLGFLRLGLLLVCLIPGLAMGEAPLKDFEGEPRTIEEFTGGGQWTVVMIWASDCHICNREIHNYVDFHFVHSDRDARMVGISIDGWAGKKDAEDFIQRHKVDFPNLIGNADAVAHWFMQQSGARWVGTPTFLLYNPSGELKAQQVGAVPVKVIEDFIGKSGRPAEPAG
ncbi:MAG: TlpA disulfide reductase family protein [Thiohalophilus sp.]|uniref:TlpA family protein disulfide reductase n=1 Tax=Thiohalophilus sp. TaxID=3028392 RepID=UPI0028705FEC|nr:TlpA disulfide reductase family protein [Thiohalophilus sp.]MDR9436133.1 TlpA disulfide reductase family protein [Thiohalophilus sp.]